MLFLLCWYPCCFWSSFYGWCFFKQFVLKLFFFSDFLFISRSIFLVFWFVLNRCFGKVKKKKDHIWKRKNSLKPNMQKMVIPIIILFVYFWPMLRLWDQDSTFLYRCLSYSCMRLSEHAYSIFSSCLLSIHDIKS